MKFIKFSAIVLTAFMVVNDKVNNKITLSAAKNTGATSFADAKITIYVFEIVNNNFKFVQHEK